MERSKREELIEEIQAWRESDPLEKAYVGFAKLKQKLAHKKGKKVSDPGAVAAAIGRKKYGKKKFQAAAAAGKKMKHMEAKKAAEDWIIKSKKLKKKKLQKMGVGF